MLKRESGAIPNFRNQSTSTVLMVPPFNFGFNSETGEDNEFQSTLDLLPEEITRLALKEFDEMVLSLQSHGVEVLRLNPPVNGLLTPDAVFPNNWIMTTLVGDIFIFPMLTANRKREVQIEEVTTLLAFSKRKVRQISLVGNHFFGSSVLEGTGAMVIDHQNSRIYAAISDRCSVSLLNQFAEISGYQEVVAFDTIGRSGKPIYHTNVVMSIGEKVAVICSECISDEDQRKLVVSKLQEHHVMVDISMEQMEQFCGNVLQLTTKQEERLWVISRSAWNGFTPEQRRTFEMDGQISVCDINTIEAIGGGSCRCMLAEIFLPKED